MENIYNVAELMLDVFSVNKIKDINMSGKAKGSGYENFYEIIIRNHADYKLPQFVNDIKQFKKKLQIAGFNAELIKQNKCKSVTFTWDVQYKLIVDDITVYFGRRYYNGKYGKMDGCNHIYYIETKDFEMIDYINNFIFLNSKPISSFFSR